MSTNGRALLAAAVAGVLVIGGVHWLNRPDTDTPREGCPTVVVAASVEKADLMAEVADRYNGSDRTVNGACYGIAISAMASGVVEKRLTDTSWDPAWGSAPDLVARGIHLAAAVASRPRRFGPTRHPGR